MASSGPMNLATRCTACGTIFRVVQDQLRVSEGWVRCGRCAEVFDAREQLFDLEHDSPPPWPPQSEEPQVPPPLPPAAPQPGPWPAAPPPTIPAAVDWPATHQPPAPMAFADEPTWQAPAETDEHDAAPPAHRREPFLDPLEEASTAPPVTREEPALIAQDEEDPRAHLPEPKGLRLPPAPVDEPALEDARPDVLLAPALQASSTPEPTPDAPPAPAPALPEPATPGFVKRAQSAARWQRPGVRLALGGVSLLLLTLLLAQLGWHYRSALAAQYPGLRPSLQAISQQLGQDLPPWQHLDGLGVESSALSPAGGSGHHYRLVLTLRNKSPWELAMPSVDLRLTDANGQQILRRVLAPAELQAGSTRLAGGAEQVLQLVFSTGSYTVAGYDIELVYP